MRVSLKRPIFTRVGYYEPDPEGVEVPDSLRDFIENTEDAEILDEPDEVKPTPDPDIDPSAGSFVAVMDGNKPQARRSRKAKKPVIDLDK